MCSHRIAQNYSIVALVLLSGCQDEGVSDLPIILVSLAGAVLAALFGVFGEPERELRPVWAVATVGFLVSAGLLTYGGL